MPDSDIQIKATLDTAAAKREADDLNQAIEDVGQGAAAASGEASTGLGQAAEAGDRAADAMRDVADAAGDAAEAANDLGGDLSDGLRKGADDAGELSRRLDGVADSVGKINARQLLGAASQLAGMGFDVWDAMHPGENSRSTVAGGAIQGGFSGAAMGAGFGPLGMLLGGLGGAALGAFTNRARRENADAAEEQARNELIAANRAQVQSVMDQIAHTRELNDFFARLGDTSRSVAERQAEAAARLATLEGRQKELAWGMAQTDVLANPVKLRELESEFTRNAAEIDRIKSMEIREARKDVDNSPRENPKTLSTRTEQITPRDKIETDQLSRLGINVGAVADNHAVQSIDRQVGEIKGVLNAILGKTGSDKVTIWR